VRDFADVRGDGSIDVRMAHDSLDSLEVDSLGLDDMDRKMLRLMIEKYGGGPVGIETLSASLSEERDTIEDVIEPYLLQLGMLERTPRGRCATQQAYAHLGIPDKRQGLF
jgi:Holliday junction DNA helicase RuvB